LANEKFEEYDWKRYSLGFEEIDHLKNIVF